MTTNSIKLDVDLKELYALNAFIGKHYLENNHQLKLIAEEIFVNIVNYSNADYIIVNIESDEYLKIEFVDNGIEFNPLLKEDYESPENIDEVQIGGLGIMLVKTFADDTIYVYENGENHLKIIKKVK